MRTQTRTQMRKKRKKGNKIVRAIKKEQKLHHIEKKFAKDIDKNVYLNIWITVIFLCLYGLLMVFSSSAHACALNAKMGNDMFYYVKRQAVFMILGFLCMLIFQYMDYRITEKLVGLLYLVSTICIIALKFMGNEENGATRWLDLGPISFQVAELTKVAVILYLSYMLKKLSGKLNGAAITILMWLVGGIQGLLILEISTDLSSALVILGITYFMTFVGTNAIKTHLVTLALAFSVVGGYVFYVYNHMPATEAELNKYPYRFQRVAAWIDPERYRFDQGFQPMQSMYAVGSGGLFGKGLGKSIQKLEYIPESQNDMILSIICEELGIIGAAVLLILYVFLLLQLVKVARHARKDLFAFSIVVGVFSHISIQSIINVAVNTGVFPNTGIPLPFISYGGTSVAFLLCEMALILSIERRRYLRPAALFLEKERRGEINGGLA